MRNKIVSYLKYEYDIEEENLFPFVTLIVISFKIIYDDKMAQRKEKYLKGKSNHFLTRNINDSVNLGSIFRGKFRDKCRLGKRGFVLHSPELFFLQALPVKSSFPSWEASFAVDIQILLLDASQDYQL